MDHEPLLPSALVGDDGLYELRFCIGRGSMGDVFEARHRLLDLPVAVKVLTGQLDEARCALFRREVQAVASLSHPGIVTVFDHGRVPASADGLLGLVAGSPWFAMELVDGGTLDELRLAHWGQLRTLLLELLDALAHCHARAIVHCDLKPSNVLLARPLDGRLRAKLSDFGVFAFDPALHREVDIRGPAGTPRYMAPEQLRNHRHELGPQTDLYALGCLAWRLCTGHAPFLAAELDQLVHQHLYEPPPPLAWRFPAPRGLESWLRRLLEKSPDDRFACAADARAALLALADGAPPPRRPTLPSHGWRPPPTTGDSRVQDPPPLHAVGLGLFGLREVPFVGRDTERDLVWRALREVHESGTSRVVVLRGPAGIGKTRLAEWLVARMHELGVARVLTCSHAPLPGPGDGLIAMLERLFRCEDLGRGAAAERVNQMLGPHHDVPIPRLLDLVRPIRARDLSESAASLIAPALDEDARGVFRPARFASLHERHGLVARFLTALAARDRPLVVRVDDVQWGGELLGLVRHVLDAQAMGNPLAALWLLTVDDEVLATRPREQAELEALLQSGPAVRCVRLGPLPDEAQRALVRGLLRLEEPLLERIVQGAAGRPLFGVLLVDELVRRGGLRPTADGEVGGAVLLDPSAGIDALWRSHVEDALAGLPHEAGLGPLEVAAALGLRVDEEEWRAACHEAGLGPATQLLETLESARLVRVERRGFAFGHMSVREMVEAQARAAGRWKRLHRACARMLAARPGYGDTLEAGERIGRHLAAAGEVTQALLPLLRGAEHRRRLGDYDGALGLLELREALCTQPLDARTERAHGLVLRARMLAATSRMDEARGLVERVAQLGVALEPWWEAHLAYVSGLIEFKLGRLPVARAHLERARAGYRAELDGVGLAESELMLSKVVKMTDGEGSLPHIEAALEAAQAAQDVLLYARAMTSLGETHVRLGRREEGRRELERALELFEDMGNPERVAAVLNDLGEVARFEGELALAEHYYRRAEHNMLAAGSRDAAIPSLNLGLVLYAGGHLEEAREQLARATLALSQAGRATYAQCGHLLLAALAGESGRFDEAAAELDRFESLHASAALYDIDLARPAEALARHAVAGNAHALGLRALAIAEAQYEALRRPEELERVRALRGVASSC